MVDVVKIYSRISNLLKRLWCQLAISYTLLSFGAMMLLVVFLYGINDYTDFHATVTLENIETRVASEQLSLALAIQDPENTQWLYKVQETLREKLIFIEHDSGTAYYRITNSSQPRVYMQILNLHGNLLLSDPIPEQWESIFKNGELPNSEKGSVMWLGENGPIWVDMAIRDENQEATGRIRILFIAKFNLFVQLRSIFDFLIFTWGYVFLLSVPIGITCGFVAARYVTRQLHKMNKITESWRKGDFEPRIALPSDDVLTLHSQYLNDMAQDLELFLGLQQSMAVTDERNRVARELHDTVKQKLFALGLQIATAKARPPVMAAAREQILEAEAITREAQHDLMEIITQLRPVGTTSTSLNDRIRSTAEDFKRRFEVEVDIRLTDSTRCNAQTEHNIIRIIQESLMNAIRHGKAGFIEILSDLNQDRIRIQISDNGVGFDPSRKAGGLGLVSMRDRALCLPDGQFEIKSARGFGTEILISWRNES